MPKSVCVTQVVSKTQPAAVKAMVSKDCAFSRANAVSSNPNKSQPAPIFRAAPFTGTLKLSTIHPEAMERSFIEGLKSGMCGGGEGPDGVDTALRLRCSISAHLRRFSG